MKGTTELARLPLGKTGARGCVRSAFASFYIYAKACGEMTKLTEGIAGNSDFAQIFHPLLSFTFRERGGNNFKVLLIISLLNIRFWDLAAAQYVNSIAFVRSLDTLPPFYVNCPIMETHPPILLNDHEISLLHTLLENAR